MTNTPATQAPDAGYHVRCRGTAKVRQELQNEQARRLLQTGQKVTVMEIAAEWLEEKANQLAG